MNEHATYWIDGIPHGAGAKWRNITPERRVIRRADAPPPVREVVPAPDRPRRGRPRKPAGEGSLDRFLAACERLAVDGVILKWALCDALGLEPSTVESYATKARKAGRWPYRFASSRRGDFARNPRGGGA